MTENDESERPLLPSNATAAHIIWSAIISCALRGKRVLAREMPELRQLIEAMTEVENIRDLQLAAGLNRLPANGGFFDEDLYPDNPFACMNLREALHDCKVTGLTLDFELMLKREHRPLLREMLSDFFSNQLLNVPAQEA